MKVKEWLWFSLKLTGGKWLARMEDLYSHIKCPRLNLMILGDFCLPVCVEVSIWSDTSGWNEESYRFWYGCELINQNTQGNSLMLHTNNPIIKHKVGLLNLTEELGNVSKACKVMGGLQRV